MIEETILNLINETEIDRTELDSYVCRGGFIYSDGHDSEVFEEWDENEEYEAKKEALIEELENGGLGVSIDVPEKWKKAFEKNPKLKERITKYIVDYIECDFKKGVEQ